MSRQIIYKALLLSVLSLFFFTTYAQNKIIKGKLSSMDDGKNVDLPGVNVTIVGTSKGTTTDGEGNFSLELAPSETSISFSFIGYTTQTIAITNQTFLNITLQTDTEQLEEVVVVGYGVQKKSDITGATASVKGDELYRQPVLTDRKSTRLNSSHPQQSRMPSSA